MIGAGNLAAWPFVVRARPVLGCASRLRGRGGNAGRTPAISSMAGRALPGLGARRMAGCVSRNLDTWRAGLVGKRNGAAMALTQSLMCGLQAHVPPVVVIDRGELRRIQKSAWLTWLIAAVVLVAQPRLLPYSSGAMDLARLSISA